MSVQQFIIWSLRLRRVEYRVAELPIFFIPVFLSVERSGQLFALTLWEGLTAFLFMLAFGDLVNCIVDRELDRTYKPHLTEAVYGLGIPVVVAQAAASAICAVGLCAHLAWVLDRWVLLPACLVGLFAAFAYSVEPFHLKSRGIWQMAFNWFGLFSAPQIFAAWLVTPWPSPGVIAVALFYGMILTGVMLVNAGEDYPEDRAMGIRTAAVELGLRAAMSVAHRLSVFGGFLLWASLFTIAGAHHVSLWRMLLTGVVALVWMGVTHFIGNQYERIAFSTEERAIEVAKEGGTFVPVLITSVALSTLLAAVAASRL